MAKDVNRGSRPGAGAISGPPSRPSHAGPGSPAQGLLIATSRASSGSLTQMAIK